MCAYRAMGGLIGVVLAGSAAADVDPATVDLASLIECKADIKTYNGFALWLTGEPDAAGKLGWQKVPTDNLFLEEFRTASSVKVFGYATNSIVFSATGPMAVLDDVSPDDLAKSLGIPAVITATGKFMAEKVIVDTKEIDAGTTFSTYITLNVSNVDTHPGKTLAGCSYRLEVIVE
jgi:hypothetical protein